MGNLSKPFHDTVVGLWSWVDFDELFQAIQCPFVRKLPIEKPLSKQRGIGFFLRVRLAGASPIYIPKGLESFYYIRKYIFGAPDGAIVRECIEDGAVMFMGRLVKDPDETSLSSEVLS